MSQPTHVIVLMLENRAFDHMLGFLPHPDPAFDGLVGTESNPAAEPSAPPVVVSPTALRTLPLDAAHDHADVMLQLTGLHKPASPYPINNSGFVASYEGVGIREKGTRGFGQLIMRCQPPRNLPVLSTLAQEFAVCTRWFSSVPGQTWPNRNFTHAGTSDGEVDNSIRLYTNKTIFERLGEAGLTWQIYHDGAAQSWAFRHLWMGAPGGGFAGHGRLLRAIEEDRLPHYAFVEPDHFWPRSSSQHPGNNKKNDADFLRGEALVRTIYSKLLDHPDVFARTLLVITYDEHGGMYDHVAPPQDGRFADGQVAAGGFRFDLLGIRVPTVLVSPLVAPGTVVTDVLDHTSIAATLGALFLGGDPDLLPRVKNAGTFHQHVSLAAPRTDLPLLAPAAPSAAAAPSTVEAPDLDELDAFQGSLVWLTEKVAAELQAANVDSSPSPEVMAAAADAAEVSPISAATLRLRQEQVSRLIWERSTAPF